MRRIVMLSITIFASTWHHKDFVYETRADYSRMNVQCTEISGIYFDIFNFKQPVHLKFAHILMRRSIKLKIIKEIFLNLMSNSVLIQVLIGVVDVCAKAILNLFLLGARAF